MSTILEEYQAIKGEKMALPFAEDVQRRLKHCVLGFCPFNSRLINHRHHKVKHAITALLQNNGFECFEKVHAIDEDGYNRFADILAFKKGSTLLIYLIQLSDLKTMNKIKPS